VKLGMSEKASECYLEKEGDMKAVCGQKDACHTDGGLCHAVRVA